MLRFVALFIFLAFVEWNYPIGSWSEHPNCGMTDIVWNYWSLKDAHYTFDVLKLHARCRDNEFMRNFHGNIANEKDPEHPPLSVVIFRGVWRVPLWLLIGILQSSFAKSCWDWLNRRTITKKQKNEIFEFLAKLDEPKAGKLSESLKKELLEIACSIDGFQPYTLWRVVEDDRELKIGDQLYYEDHSDLYEHLALELYLKGAKMAACKLSDIKGLQEGVWIEIVGGKKCEPVPLSFNDEDSLKRITLAMQTDGFRQALLKKEATMKELLKLYRS